MFAIEMLPADQGDALWIEYGSASNPHRVLIDGGTRRTFRTVKERAEKVAEYRAKFSNPYIAAERGFVDAILEPSKTRREIARALRQLGSKRSGLPPKKHGNIPL